VQDPDGHPQLGGAGPLVWLDDPEDVRLDLYRALSDTGRRVQVEAAHNVFVVEGRLAVARLLTSAYRVRSLLVDDHQVRTASNLVEATLAQGAPVYVAPRPVVARTVGFALHRGVVAVADRPLPTATADVLAAAYDRTSPAGGPPLVAVLQGLNDHENIGALFRNAAAFGVGGILLDPTCADPLYRRSIRVSVGHVLHVPFARLAAANGLDQVRASGFVIAALAPHPQADGGTAVIGLAELNELTHEVRPPAGVALLLGAEGEGLSPATLAASDVVVTIPMADGVDSLNVATAAGGAFQTVGGL